MAGYDLPLPVPTEISRRFWEGCKNHELWLQKCKQCDRVIFFPRKYCPSCLSEELGWTKSSGRGKIHSFTVVHTPFGKEWASLIPYTVVLLELEEGVRMVGRLIECKPEDVKVGMNLQIVFEDVTPDVTLPLFKPMG